MSLHLDTLFWFRGRQYLLFLLNAAANTIVEVFAFTWTGFELTLLSEEEKSHIFGSNPWSTTLRGEYANLFTTGATELVLEIYFDHIHMCGPGRKSNSQQ